jgi:hypothetical protein
MWKKLNFSFTSKTKGLQKNPLVLKQQSADVFISKTKGFVVFKKTLSI